MKSVAKPALSPLQPPSDSTSGDTQVPPSNGPGHVGGAGVVRAACRESLVNRPLPTCLVIVKVLEYSQFLLAGGQEINV